jgi:glucose/arabinose dehydrogenase
MIVPVISFVLIALWLALVGVGIVLITQRRWLGAIFVGLGVLALAAQAALSFIPVGIGEPLIRIPQNELVFAATAAAGVVGVLVLIGRARKFRVGASDASLIALLVLIPIFAAGSLWGLGFISTPERERERDAAKRGIALAPGFRAEIYTRGTMDNPTTMTFGPDGNLYVADIAGDLWVVGQDKSITKIGGGFQLLLGLLWHNDELFVSSAGKIEAFKVRDGVLTDRREVVGNLPSMIYMPHSNNSLTLGPDGRIYFGVGSTVGRGEEPNPRAGAILSVSPDGGDVTVIARGLGNPFEVGFNSAGEMFSGDNPPMAPDGLPAPDEFNQIVEGGDYGFLSREFLRNTVREPLLSFPQNSTPTGLVFYTGKRYPQEYVDNAFVVLWNRGEMVRMVLSRDGRGSVRADASRFGSGFLYPIDVINGPDGNLYVADFGTSAIYRIVYVGQ